MVNIWKISTLALTGILAIVVGQGGIQKTEACDTNAEDVAKEQSEIRLSAALTFLDRAEAQIKAATAARPLPRARAIEGIQLVKSEVKLSLQPPPPPPRPVKRSENTKVIFF